MTAPVPPRAPGWARLRQFTAARIGLARSGSSLATSEQLDFQLAHARARDAVYDALDAAELMRGLQESGLAAMHLRSAVGDRKMYLARPDLGRRLDIESRKHMEPLPRGHDLVFVAADGLSARAVMRHARPLLTAALPTLSDWSIGPVAVVEQGRVAIGDEIGAILDAALVAVLIGERPGLSAPDSLGVYLTWEPKIGRKDAERNCISNIRPEGLGYGPAAAQLLYLLTEARRRKLTGVRLKEQAALGALQQPLRAE